MYFGCFDFRGEHGFLNCDDICTCVLNKQFELFEFVFDGNAGVRSGGGVVAVSTYMGGTRGSGVFASAGDMLEMSMVRGVGGVCDMCMCLARGGVGGVGVSG